MTNRKQRVVVDGEKSSQGDVLSGVPQGTVLGPLLFLLHINDLPAHVKSIIRLFADDCLLYRKIKDEQDLQILQDDLASLEIWAESWGMKFNASKCYIMSLHRTRKPLTKFYQLNGHILQQVSDNPYLGLMIRDDLQWSTHISKTCAKANSTLGFIRRNLRNCNTHFKQTAYISLVRSVLEYSSTVWDPYLVQDISKLERVQRSAARFVKSDYGQKSSVTKMMEELNWKPLHQRRREHRLVLLYKIINNLVAIPKDDYLDFNTRDSRQGHSKQILVKSSDRGCNVHKYSFFPRTILDWNELSQEEVDCPTLDKFKAVVQKKI